MQQTKNRNHPAVH